MVKNSKVSKNNKELKIRRDLTCKYGCGWKFDNTPNGQAALMRHYKYECPKNPMISKKTVSTLSLEQEQSSSKEINKSVLERIIREASQNRKIPAVVRMVERYMDDPKKSFEMLNHAMQLADFRPSEIGLILYNWAHFTGVDLSEATEIIKKEIKEVKETTESKEEPKKFHEKLAYSTYANCFRLSRYENEITLLFGQFPSLDDEEILITRIHIQRDLANRIIKKLIDLLVDETKV